MFLISPCICQTMMQQLAQKVAYSAFRAKVINGYVQEKTREYVMQNVESNNNNVQLQQKHLLEQWKLQFKIDKK